MWNRIGKLLGWSTYTWDQTTLTITGSTTLGGKVPLSIPSSKHIFTFCGVQRCGNHAIINWVINHFNKEECVHHNNLDLGAVTEDSGEVAIYSYENHLPTDVFQSATHPIGSPYIILRDPYNWLASLLAFGPRAGLHLYLSWYIGYANYAINNPSQFISYNQWVLSENYKNELRKRMYLPTLTKEVSIKNVASQGGGSSFDGMRLNGRANEMEVLYRWKSGLQDSNFRSIMFDNKEIFRKISIELFDYNPIWT